MADTRIEVSVEPFGPTTEELAQVGRDILIQPSLREFVGHDGARLLYVETLDDGDKSRQGAPTAPSHFRATLYDDRQRRTILVDGPLRDLKKLSISESATPPAPSDEEYAAAVELLHHDERLARSLRAEHLQPYPPIPAMILTELPDGTFERRIAVGLLPRDSAIRHEIVAVDLGRGSVIRFPHGTPGAPHPEDAGLCGVPHSAGQATAGKGTAGQVWVTIKQGGTTLWHFLAVRPAASSGTNGSGIELRFVDYKGKRVLYRAHVPILNVKYDHDACGPYRDWQYQEGMIQANGADVAPGFRLCNAPAQTIMESGSDAGNYLGVAIYVAGSDVVLVSEMQAGWYRYVSKWTFAANGTLKPRFGFAAVESQCVCNVHHHHAYWRLDFDIGTAAHNRVQEFNDPILVGNSNWHTKSYEIRRPRDYGRKRKWRVENTVTGNAYDIVPGPDDGIASAQSDAPFGRGDFWVLRYRSSEIDDGSVATGPPYEANIDQWVNGEPVSDHDVVIWYGAHFTHDVHEHGPAHPAHIVGPDLKLVKW